jgi:hypothetical protein
MCNSGARSYAAGRAPRCIRVEGAVGVDRTRRQIVTARGRNDEPGPEEEAELAREERRDVRDEVLEGVAVDPAEEDDGEETEEELLEIDQTELDELGLTLDDPHQPEAE